MWFGLHPFSGWIVCLTLLSMRPRPRCPGCGAFVAWHFNICPFCGFALRTWMEKTKDPFDEL